jgi:hypothetical protein
MTAVGGAPTQTMSVAARVEQCIGGCHRVRRGDVGDGDAVSVAREVAQHFGRASEWSFAVDDPLGVAQRCQIDCEASGIGERNVFTKELELSGLVGTGKLLQDQPAEQTRANVHGEKEVGSAGDPALTIKGDIARSLLRSGRVPGFLRFAPPPAWPASSVIRASGPKPVTFWPRSTAGSPKASIYAGPARRQDAARRADVISSLLVCEDSRPSLTAWTIFGKRLLSRNCAVSLIAM